MGLSLFDVVLQFFERFFAKASAIDIDHRQQKEAGEKIGLYLRTKRNP